MDDSFQNGLVALAGGGQAGATPIAARGAGSPTVSRFTTVATIHDSCILPPSSPGLRYTILNAGAAGLDVYPAVGEFINGGAVNVVLTITQAKGATFFCCVPGTWNTVTGA